MSEFMWLSKQKKMPYLTHYCAGRIVNTFSATTCTTPNPRFKATLSDSESTILSPTSIDSAHGGKAPLLTQSDAILSARTPDLDARSTCATVARLGGANHHPYRLDLDHMGNHGRIFSPDFSGCCVAGWLFGVVLDDGGNWGNVGDEGGDEVIGPRSAGINDEVEASDARPVLGERASEKLDFGGMGLNYKTSCELVRDGRRMIDGEGTYFSEVQRGEDLLASWPCRR
jgi:hypothetical protein